MPLSEHTSLHNSKREILWAQSNHQSSNALEGLSETASQGTGADLGSCAANTERFSTRYSDCGKEESVMMGVVGERGSQGPGGSSVAFSCFFILLVARPEGEVVSQQLHNEGGVLIGILI